MSPVQDLKGRKVALIGGAGFIGHNLALSLQARGAEVEIVDSLQVNNLLSFASEGSAAPDREMYMKMLNQRLDLLRAAKINMHPVDARDYHALSRILVQIKPQAIVHLAAISHAGKSNKDPFSTFDHSLRTLENALDYARGGGVDQFVFLSSSMAYGNFKTAEVTEEHPLEPIGIYGALKLAGEKMVIAYNQVFGLPYTILRPSALYGQRCVSRRVAQVYIETALKGGTLRMDGDGSERLDFTYIDDLTDGIGLCLANPKARGEIFNLTYGAARSIKELGEIVQKHFPGTKIESVPRDALMPFRGTLNVDKARRLIGYAPKNPIDVGIPKYIEWYRSLTNTPAPKPVSA
ncbi:MAG: NAD(P)-dependent oxidoreductase [Elusimicrobiota bacterium]|nr:NAD(P)-dependent oxidoreductase [Elusimicrobiota bacterium]